MEQTEPRALEEDFKVDRVRLPLNATAPTVPAPQAAAPTATDLADNDVLAQDEPGAVEPDYEKYMAQQHQRIRPPLRNSWNKNNPVAIESIEILSACAKIDAGFDYKTISGGLKRELQGQ